MIVTQSSQSLASGRPDIFALPIPSILSKLCALAPLREVILRPKKTCLFCSFPWSIQSNIIQHFLRKNMHHPAFAILHYPSSFGSARMARDAVTFCTLRQPMQSHANLRNTPPSPIAFFSAYRHAIPTQCPIFTLFCTKTELLKEITW